MTGYTSETMLLHILMTNGFWEDGLGSRIDIGPALCVTITKENGKCVYRSPCMHSTEDEVNGPEKAKKRQTYDQMIYSKLGSSASTQDFDEITQLLNLNYMKMMKAMGFCMQGNARRNQLPSHMTPTLVLR